MSIAIKRTDKMYLDSIESKVRDIARQYPDSVYKEFEGAYYYKRGRNETCTPGCIIGLAIKALDSNTYKNLDSVIRGKVKWVIREAYGINGGEWLEIVQDEQDSGRPWSECISIADELEGRNKNEYESRLHRSQSAKNSQTISKFCLHRI